MEKYLQYATQESNIATDLLYPILNKIFLPDVSVEQREQKACSRWHWCSALIDGDEASDVERHMVDTSAAIWRNCVRKSQAATRELLLNNESAQSVWPSKRQQRVRWEKAPPCIKDRQTDINIAALFCFERRSTSCRSQSRLEEFICTQDIKKSGRCPITMVRSGCEEHSLCVPRKLITYLSKCKHTQDTRSRRQRRGHWMRNAKILSLSVWGRRLWAHRGFPLRANYRLQIASRQVGFDPHWLAASLSLVLQ